jgi:hydrogenase maturation protease
MSRFVIGIGNPFRCDDAVGLAVARRVHSIPAHERTAGSYDLMDLWGDSDDVVIVDGMQSGAPAGTVRVFEADREPLPARSFTSTHAAGVRDAVEMARRLGRLPARLTVYGIEVRNVKPGFQMTPAVRKAVNRVVAEIDHA